MLKKLIALSLVILGISLYFQLGSKEGKVVETKSGFVKGVISLSRDGREFYEWLGIPFAKPPVGDLRFASPQPVNPWNGVFDASQYGSRCPQVDPFTLLILGNEDCLSLNIHVPKIEGGKNLPVMIYIHGGGYNTMGSFDYRPHYFMDEDVILVTFNYRLGIFGFMSTGDKSIRGNMGLKDQTLALKWIKRNIQYFGGNPDQITIFGESAGGASVHYQMLSPTSKGLFQRAISLSGVATTPWAIEGTHFNKKRTEDFAERVNCPTHDSKELVTCLRTRSWEELMDANIADMATFHLIYPHKLGRLFTPTIEAVDDSEAFLTTHPLDLLEKGLVHRVPWMAGVVADEGLITSACFHTRPETMETYESQWIEYTMRALGIQPNPSNASEIADKIWEYYFQRPRNLDIKFKQEQYTKLLSDVSFNFNVHHAASIQKQFSPVYLYHLGRRGGVTTNTLYASLHRLNKKSLPMKLLSALGIFIQVCFNKFLLGEAPTDFGVAHADDLVLMFWYPFVFKFSADEEADIKFSKDFVKLLASFAKNEEMFFRGVAFTPTNSNGQLKYLDLNDRPMVIDAPFQERMEFLESLGIMKLRI